MSNAGGWRDKKPANGPVKALLFSNGKGGYANPAELYIDPGTDRQDLPSNRKHSQSAESSISEVLSGKGRPGKGLSLSHKDRVGHKPPYSADQVSPRHVTRSTRVGNDNEASTATITGNKNKESQW